MNPLLRRCRDFCGLLLATLLLVPACGCANRAKTNARVRRAYLAGQQDAPARLQQSPPPPASTPTVSFIGTVKNPLLIWSPDLTLAQALVDAEYAGAADPVLVVVYRNNQQISFTSQQLLNGEDFPLEAGDIVQIQ